MNTTTRQTLLVMTLSALGSWNAASAQVAPPTILEVDVENYVSYVEDTTDVTRFATLPNATPAAVPKNFYTSVIIGDIVAVNGQPAKGTVTFHLRKIGLTATPNPGDSIADTGRSQFSNTVFEILGNDGTPVGSVMSVGLAGAGAPPPGSPLTQTQGNNAIVGGTGAFFGVRGTTGQSVTSQTVAARQASIAEDPANRRKNGGGKVRFLLTVIPMSVPQIVPTSSGPAVTHSGDFSLVTPSKPAVAGEILSAFVTGLGPTRPGVDPGRPFPSSPLAAVNSPVEVKVNGKSAEILAAVGYPGSLDSYQVNFRMPADTAKGTATVQVIAAWVAGSVANIAVQ
jgi:uncharacterized protein (TIGR03437 family)